MTDQTTYISIEGLAALKEELQKRLTLVRKEITERIGSAKELGDLSENFEYHVAKDDQAQNESRILELEDMIRSAVIVTQKSGGSIGLGSTFTVEINQQEKVFQMVGATEADPLAGKISNDSPLGSAFLGKKEGEIVDVNVPSGTVRYKIVHVA